jgi:hypothetical protein
MVPSVGSGGAGANGTPRAVSSLAPLGPAMAPDGI